MAIPLFENWQRLRARVGRAAHLLFLTDYDGTLTPLVDHYWDADLHADVRSAIAALAQRSNTTVAVVSGRALEDVSARVGLEGLFYAGNHGMEINGPGCRILFLAKNDLHRELPLLADELTAALSTIPGAIVERKRLSLAVHHRLVTAERVCEVDTIVSKCLFSSPCGFKLTTGKDVYEILPTYNCNKGIAAAWILAQLSLPDVLMVCIGDDRTDEDMFSACDAGITIKVGTPHDTCAQYFLASPAHVLRFMEALVRT